MSTLRVKIVREGAKPPRYASEGAAGLDLSAAIDAPLTIAPGERIAVPTGVAIELPREHEGQVRPRSGLARRHGLTVANAPGTIDEDYRGEIEVLLVNLGRDDVSIQPGDRIAQLVVAPVRRVDVEIVSALSGTARGGDGFGSTGV